MIAFHVKSLTVYCPIVQLKAVEKTQGEMLLSKRSVFGSFGCSDLKLVGKSFEHSVRSEFSCVGKATRVLRVHVNNGCPFRCHYIDRLK